ncbi:MAG: HD domain-containing phosphohydrolase, partial [Pseudomonadota bacterium]
GQGYPRGLQAPDISYFAKIVAVTDSYDAINSDRIYNRGKSTLESLRILYDAAGSFFDADIVVSFINLIGIYPPGEIVELSNGEVAIIISCSRDSKLRPRLLCVLNASKQPCPERIIDLKHDPADDAGRPYRVQAVYPSGAFGLDIEAYRRRGLIIHQDVEAPAAPNNE